MLFRSFDGGLGDQGLGVAFSLCSRWLIVDCSGFEAPFLTLSGSFLWGQQSGYNEPCLEAFP